MAASRTKWQSEQVARWLLISLSTDAESRPSKYQQIKWIVSLQLISPVPQVPHYDAATWPSGCISSAKRPVLRLKYYMLIIQRLRGDYRFSVRSPGTIS